MIRLPGLDGLRGVAVLAVVLFHLGFAPSGFLGVDVFFVLSGFLITSLLAKEIEQTGGLRLRRFTARRLFRLYPALLVMVLIVTCLGLLAGRTGNSLHDAGAALTYTGNLTALHGLLDHVWTLGLEEQFYLAWPLLMLISRRRGGGVLPVVLVAAVLAVDLINGQSGTIHTYVRAMGLPVGCALALSPNLRNRLATFGPFALALLILLFFVPLPGWAGAGWPISVGALLAAPCVSWLAARSMTWLDHPVMRWSGLRSYSLYLWHFPLISLWFHHAPGFVTHPLAVVLATITSLIAAELSYRCVEAPVLRFRDRALAAGGEQVIARA